LDSLSDEQLVSLTQQGNTQAFNQLTARWETSIYRFALRNLGNSEDARDICQEALLKAYLGIKKLREGGKFKAWLHHIALNLIRDRFRSPRSRTEVRSIDAEDQQSGPFAMQMAEQNRTHAAMERGVMMRTAEAILGKIPEEQRWAIMLREYHGFSSEEIGEITGVPAATVRTRIFYGLRSVRRMLGEQGAG